MTIASLGGLPGGFAHQLQNGLSAEGTDFLLPKLKKLHPIRQSEQKARLF